MGKLIVIEGLDGCGKSTQLKLLTQRLKNAGYDFKEVSFPNYQSKACEPVKMYLGGEFGKGVNDVNAYAASVFYAVDRYASYKSEWGSYYHNGGTVICGRYTTSNAVHQCSKLDEALWYDFSNWLYDFEYNKMELPKPDAVIFLSMPEEVSDRLLIERYSGDASKKDIHESDRAYQKKCREAAVFAAKGDGWITVDCVDNGRLRSIDDISDEIFEIVTEIIKE